jgi:hypothetical protein
MTHDIHSQLLRIRVSGATCRSKERLLSRALERVPGLSAAALGEDDVLTALVSPDALDVDRLLGAIVGAGLVPQELLEARPTLTTGGSDAR